MGILCCPKCKSNNIIKRGQRKTKKGITQVYGCNDCNKRFSHNVDLSDTDEIATLKEANKILLENNMKLREENAQLILAAQHVEDELKIAQSEKQNCKQKCEVVISEKERLIQQKEAYIKSLHGTVWHLKNNFECKFYSFVETDKGFKLELQFHDKSYE